MGQPENALDQPEIRGPHEERVNGAPYRGPLDVRRVPAFLHCPLSPLPTQVPTQLRKTATKLQLLQQRHRSGEGEIVRSGRRGDLRVIRIPGRGSSSSTRAAANIQHTIPRVLPHCREHIASAWGTWKSSSMKGSGVRSWNRQYKLPCRHKTSAKRTFLSPACPPEGGVAGRSMILRVWGGFYETTRPADHELQPLRGMRRKGIIQRLVRKECDGKTPLSEHLHRNEPPHIRCHCPQSYDRRTITEYSTERGNENRDDVRRV